MICRTVKPTPIAIILETTKPSSAVVATLFNTSINMSACRCGVGYPLTSPITRTTSDKVIWKGVSLFWFWQSAMQVGFVIAYDSNQSSN